MDDSIKILIRDSGENRAIYLSATRDGCELEVRCTTCDPPCREGIMLTESAAFHLGMELLSWVQASGLLGETSLLDEARADG